MTTEAAKIIIDAEDLASKKFEQAAKNAEKNIKAVKDAGAKAKASTEFFGVLANTLGGTELGSYAGQLGALTEKVSAFSEVSKAGGAGALAFKAGLVSVAGVLAFNIGKALGDVIFQTQALNKEIERSTQLYKELSAQTLDAARSAEGKTLEQLDKDVAAKNEQIKQYRKSVDELEGTWKGWFTTWSGDAKLTHEMNKQQLADAEAMKKIFNDQAIAMRKQIELDKEAAALAEQKKNEEAIAEKAKEDAKELADIQRKAADDAERAAQKKVDEAKRIENIRENEIAKLEEERILLTEGAEAAKRFALERQGVDKDSAARIAAAQTELEKLKEETGGGGSVAIGQQAVQSRLLTRGPAEKGIDKIEKNTKDALRKFDQMITQLDKYKPSMAAEVVG
jgi:hypothetical protein